MATSEIKGKTFGEAKVEYGEDPRGYLICHADGTYGRCYTASRDWNGVSVAVRAATMGAFEGMDIDRVGISFGFTSASQEGAVIELAYKEAEAQIARLSFEGDLSDDQAEMLYDSLGHIAFTFQPIDQVQAYRDLSSQAFDLGRAS